MRSKIFLFLLILCTVPLFAEQTDTLAIFSQKKYDGWVYNRSDVELDKSNISKLKINLFNYNNEDYTLTSPVFTCIGYDSVRVSVVYVSTIESVNVRKLALTFKFIDNNDVQLYSTTVDAAPLVEQTLSVKVPAKVLKGYARLTLAALKADVDNNAAVRSVLISGLKAPNRFDVNCDGDVDIADLNMMINLILHITSGYNGDVNGDGKIDIADINLLINYILGI